MTDTKNPPKNGALESSAPAPTDTQMDVASVVPVHTTEDVAFMTDTKNPPKNGAPTGPTHTTPGITIIANCSRCLRRGDCIGDLCNCRER